MWPGAQLRFGPTWPNVLVDAASSRSRDSIPVDPHSPASFPSWSMPPIRHALRSCGRIPMSGLPLSSYGRLPRAAEPLPPCVPVRLPAPRRPPAQRDSCLAGRRHLSSPAGHRQSHACRLSPDCCRQTTDCSAQKGPEVLHCCSLLSCL